MGAYELGMLPEVSNSHKEGDLMRFYTKAHAYYCGIDLHARWMYLCVLDQQGEVLLHRNLRACPEVFLKAIEPFRQDLVACEQKAQNR